MERTQRDFPGCPKNLLAEAMDTPNGGLVRRCFRILSAKNRITKSYERTVAGEKKNEALTPRAANFEGKKRVRCGTAHAPLPICSIIETWN